MTETPETSENVVLMISARLREWIHEVNNALFITKGFREKSKRKTTFKIRSTTKTSSICLRQ
jgi:uncharacterized protein YbcV (DUF1398 family)